MIKKIKEILKQIKWVFIKGFQDGLDNEKFCEVCRCSEEAHEDLIKTEKHLESLKLLGVCKKMKWNMRMRN